MWSNGSRSVIDLRNWDNYCYSLMNFLLDGCSCRRMWVPKLVLGDVDKHLQSQPLLWNDFFPGNSDVISLAPPNAVNVSLLFISEDFPRTIWSALFRRICLLDWQDSVLCNPSCILKTITELSPITAWSSATIVHDCNKKSHSKKKKIKKSFPWCKLTWCKCAADFN